MLSVVAFVGLMSFNSFAANTGTTINEVGVTVTYDDAAQPGTYKVTTDDPNCLVQSVNYDRNQNILDVYLKAYYSHTFGVTKMAQIHYNMDFVTMTAANKRNSATLLHIRFCPSSGSWSEDANGRYFTRFDGSRVNSGWYYVPDGSCEIEGESPHKVNCYYLGEDGYMLRNATTPDGYYIDETGIWTKN